MIHENLHRFVLRQSENEIENVREQDLLEEMSDGVDGPAVEWGSEQERCNVNVSLTDSE